MKLSIVVVCWNDLEVVRECLRSIFLETGSREPEGLAFEVIVSDNGSTDGSVEYIRQNHPQVRIVENGRNLGFSKANNTGLRLARGEYVLILNPDTIIHNRALEKLVLYVDEHPEAGAFGCRVLNPDGSLQISARVFPTVWRSLVSALCLRRLGHISDVFLCDSYAGWDGTTERRVDYQSGCCVMFRGELLRQLGGFDERFFYHYEETDLCLRLWKAGSPILFFPGAEITHLGGQSVRRFPVRFELEKHRNRYRFFYKHYGPGATRRIRIVCLIHVGVRKIVYGLFAWLKPSEELEDRLGMYRVAMEWNKRLDPIRFIETGDEPDLGYEPFEVVQKMSVE